MLTVRPATADDVREFASWRYDPPYDAYDITMDLNDAVDYFLDPDVHCFTLVEGNEVAGYCTFGHDAQVPGGDYQRDALDIGLGIEPDRTGSGYGRRYVATVVAHARATFGPDRLRVTIASGNGRALRVWARAGFEEVSRFKARRTTLGSLGFSIHELSPTTSNHSKHDLPPNG